MSHSEAISGEISRTIEFAKSTDVRETTLRTSGGQSIEANGKEGASDGTSQSA